MRKIIKYLTFTSNRQMIEWQEANPNVQICTVQPLVQSGKVESNTEQSVDMSVEYQVFVTYYEED